ncbi:MAG: competence/damage-inducible protein A [Ignavibacteria bacterium]|nr:competence/damage-inducible protein A [Ignavibacteria bacterium]
MPVSKIISIGDEILIGQISNTNSQFIAEKLFSTGIPVKKIITIGDNKEELTAELDDSALNYDVTVITGGLGPTHDDITKPVMTEYFGDELILDENILENVRTIFKSRGIKMPEINKEQALVPKSAMIIWNRNGTAPGMYFEKEDKHYIALPGVPFEMKPMLTDSVIPMLREKYSDKIDYVLKSKTYLTTGISESVLFEIVGDIKQLTGDDKLAFLPSAAGVRLRVDIRATDEEHANAKLNAVENKLNEKIGKYVYGSNDDLLEEIIGKLLAEKNKTLSTAESCTGGLLASLITDISGSSKYFLGGVNVYSNESKVNILNVSNDLLVSKGAVSEETAVQMAVNSRKIFSSDYSLSITGIAGPEGGSEEKPVGLVYIGFASPEKQYAKQFLFGQRRDNNKLRSAKMALEILRKELLQI